MGKLHCRHRRNSLQSTSPLNTHQAEKSFRKILNEAAKRHIPAGRIPKIKVNYPSEALRLAQQRDSLRTTNPNDARIAELTNEIQQIVNEHRRMTWQAHLEDCPNGSKQLWSTIQGISGKKKRPPLSAICFNRRQLSDAKKCAANFCRQFIEHPTNPDKARRAVRRRFKKLGTDHNPPIFTPEEVSAAMNNAKSSKALGPDGIATVMLKKLGPAAISYMTNLFNMTMQTLNIPTIWKEARIVPIPKPNKPTDQGASYRPISLLSPVAKILEALLLPQLQEHFVLADHQHGFRKGRSTTTALAHLTSIISDGLNHKRPHLRTIVVALDLSKAFDTVDHAVLYNDILNSTLPVATKRFLIAYLNGRRGYVEFRNKKSNRRRIKMGVPQGGVLSPILFNLYVSSLPTPPPEVTIISYADDCSIVCSAQTVDEATDKINEYLATLKEFFDSRKLQLNAQKSTATLFTSWTREVRGLLGIQIDNAAIPTVRYPKILGVTFDNLFKFSKHATEVNQKLSARNRILRALASSSWGKDKETITTTYKAIGRSILNYAVPIWTPALSDTQWTNLQTRQNNALRTATGCFQMAHEDHLHQETAMLPVEQHNIMLCKQFVLSSLNPDHPAHEIVSRPTPYRCIRKDLCIYKDAVTPLAPAIWDPESNRHALDTIHKETVEAYISSSEKNRVLNTHPPQINSNEKALPRKTRCTLAQLRSGFCNFLMSYKARIVPGTSDRCPDCGIHAQTTQHLFSCPSHPTSLTPIDLWTQPVESARFLGLEI